MAHKTLTKQAKVKVKELIKSWQAQVTKEDIAEGKKIVKTQIVNALTCRAHNIIFTFHKDTGRFSCRRAGLVELRLGLPQNNSGIRAALDRLYKHLDSDKNPMMSVRKKRDTLAKMVVWELEIDRNMQDRITNLTDLLDKK